MNIIVNTKSYKYYENMKIILRRKINKVWFISYFGLLNVLKRLGVFSFLSSFKCNFEYKYFCKLSRNMIHKNSNGSFCTASDKVSWGWWQNVSIHLSKKTFSFYYVNRKNSDLNSSKTALKSSFSSFILHLFIDKNYVLKKLRHLCHKFINI